MPAKVINQWEGEDEDDDVKVSTTFCLQILIAYPWYLYRPIMKYLRKNSRPTIAQCSQLEIRKYLVSLAVGLCGLFEPMFPFD